MDWSLSGANWRGIKEKEGRVVTPAAILRFPWNNKHAFVVSFGAAFLAVLGAASECFAVWPVPTYRSSAQHPVVLSRQYSRNLNSTTYTPRHSIIKSKSCPRTYMWRQLAWDKGKVLHERNVKTLHQRTEAAYNYRGYVHRGVILGNLMRPVAISVCFEIVDGIWAWGCVRC